MGMKLDRKQGYGHISGESNGAVFEQGGRLFDADGDEVSVVVPDAPAAAVQGSVPVSALVKAKASGKGRKTAVKTAVIVPDAAAKPGAQSSIVDSQLAAQGL